MVEKLKVPKTIIWDNTGEAPLLRHEIINNAYEKINELVDAVNNIVSVQEKLIDSRFVVETKDEEPSENMLTKSLRMEKEFAEEECKRLQLELDRTRKALDVAINAMKSAGTHNSINCIARGEDPSKDDVGITINHALNEITAPEQKE